MSNGVAYAASVPGCGNEDPVSNQLVVTASSHDAP